MIFSNKPLVNKRSRFHWANVQKPAKMSEKTFSRIMLQRASIANPRKYGVSRERWAIELSKLVGCTQIEADLWLNAGTWHPLRAFCSEF